MKGIAFGLDGLRLTMNRRRTETQRALPELVRFLAVQLVTGRILEGRAPLVFLITSRRRDRRIREGREACACAYTFRDRRFSRTRTTP